MDIRSTRWVVCLLALVSSQLVAGERTWRMATTPHYRLISQLNERETAEWMRGFDQFILSTSDVLKMNLQALTPLTVVIFDRDKDYAPYKLQRNVAGQFVSRPTWSMIEAPPSPIVLPLPMPPRPPARMITSARGIGKRP